MHEPAPIEQTRIRLRVVRWPAVGFPPIRAIVLMSALVCVLFISIAIIHSVMSRAFPSNYIGGVHVLFISVPLSIALSLLIFSLHIRRVDEEYRRLRSTRWRRLRRIIERPELHFRYPHRLFEHAFYESPQIPFRRASFVRRCRAGDLILCNAFAPGDRLLPRPNDIAFEPIDMLQERERITSYIQAVRRQFGRPPRGDRPKTAIADGVSERTLVLIKNWVWRLLIVLGVAQCIYIATRTFTGGWGPEVYLPAIAITLGVLALVWRLFFERRWWLASGGIILREFRFWRSGMSVRLFTPETTPLVIDARSGVAYVVHRSNVLRFDCPGDTWWAVAAAWMSTATPPTLEQVRLYAGD